MRCCHGNGLNPKIDNQKISQILTVPILVNLNRENFKRNYPSFLSNLCTIGRVFTQFTRHESARYIIKINNDMADGHCYSFACM